MINNYKDRVTSFIKDVSKAFPFNQSFVKDGNETSWDKRCVEGTLDLREQRKKIDYLAENEVQRYKDRRRKNEAPDEDNFFFGQHRKSAWT